MRLAALVLIILTAVFGCCSESRADCACVHEPCEIMSCPPEETRLSGQVEVVNGGVSSFHYYGTDVDLGNGDNFTIGEAGLTPDEEGLLLGLDGDITGIDVQIQVCLDAYEYNATGDLVKSGTIGCETVVSSFGGTVTGCPADDNCDNCNGDHCVRYRACETATGTPYCVEGVGICNPNWGICTCPIFSLYCSAMPPDPKWGFGMTLGTSFGCKQSVNYWDEPEACAFRIVRVEAS